MPFKCCCWTIHYGASVGFVQYLHALGADVQTNYWPRVMWIVNHPWGVGVLRIVVNPRESYLQHVWKFTEFHSKKDPSNRGTSPRTEPGYQRRWLGRRSKSFEQPLPKPEGWVASKHSWRVDAKNDGETLEKSKKEKEALKRFGSWEWWLHPLKNATKRSEKLMSWGRSFVFWMGFVDKEVLSLGLDQILEKIQPWLFSVARGNHLSFALSSSPTSCWFEDMSMVNMTFSDITSF